MLLKRIGWRQLAKALQGADCAKASFSLASCSLERLVAMISNLMPFTASATLSIAVVEASRHSAEVPSLLSLLPLESQI